MSHSKKAIVTLTVLAAILVASTLFGNFHAGKWTETVDKSSAKGWASPQSFAPSYSPSGSWIICVEGARGFGAQMEQWLRDLLSPLAGGDADALKFVSEIPAAHADANILHVIIEADSLWTPLYVTFSDRVSVRYSNRNLTGWPESDAAIGVLSLGEMRVNAKVAAAGNFIGIIGRPYLADHRAKVLSDNVKLLITEAYEGVREAAK